MLIRQSDDSASSLLACLLFIYPSASASAFWKLIDAHRPGQSPCMTRAELKLTSLYDVPVPENSVMSGRRFLDNRAYHKVLGPANMAYFQFAPTQSDKFAHSIRISYSQPKHTLQGDGLDPPRLA